MYGVLGRLPLQAVRKYNIIKYWAKILSTDKIILEQCYLEIPNTKNWVYLNLVSNVWRQQTVNFNLLPIIKQRIFDQAKQSIFAK